MRGQGEGSNGQPGDSHIYIRGVVSGGDGNHSGSQPSVGVYLDEQPVTTIDGTPDVHIYDVQRIEVLEGPQGTLFGASSESGTVRIITNKPDPTHFAAGYDLQGNQVTDGGAGYEVEAFVNIPITPNAAVRLVGWDERDAGYISNVAGTDRNACIVDGVRISTRCTSCRRHRAPSASSSRSASSQSAAAGGHARRRPLLLTSGSGRVSGRDRDLRDRDLRDHDLRGPRRDARARGRARAPSARDRSPAHIRPI